MTEKYIKSAICWVQKLNSWIRVSDINLIKDKDGDYYSNPTMVHMHTIYPYEDWMEEYIGTDRDIREDERMKLENVLKKKKKNYLSGIVSDLLTGNYLLGRKRTDGQMSLMKEFCSQAESGGKLSRRQVGLILEMSKMFYGGIEDMCEQLNVNTEKIKDAVLN